MEKFTVEEFRVYLRLRKNLEDALYNLSEGAIKIANIPDEKIFEDDDTDFDFSEEDELDNWYLRQQEY